MLKKVLAASAGLQALVIAISQAEGFYVPGSRAARNHNPGDLTLDITGTGVGWDGPFVIYANDGDGTAALTKQVAEMLDGTSGIYNPNMSIQEVANRYTKTNQMAWAQIVAQSLGVPSTTKLSELA